jgi:hypothetical protein
LDSVYTDFSKAFDQVNHQLLSNLRTLWLRSYLTGFRFQWIRIGDAVSKDIRVTLGVSQESHR